MANTKVTGDLLADGTLFARHLNESHGITTSVIGEGTNLFYTDTRVGTYLGTYLPANGYDTATNIIASIVDSAPVTLDTLNELAAALGDDPNFATTVTNSLAGKLPLTGGTLTGALSVNGIITSNSSNAGDYVRLYAGSGSAQWDIYGNGENLRFSENSSGGGSVVIDSNLSIGNTNNTYKLDVSGTGRFIAGSGDPIFRVMGGGDGSGGGKGNIRSSDQGGANYWDFGRDNLTTGNFVITTGGGSPILTLTTAGAATFSSSVTATNGYFSGTGSGPFNSQIILNNTTSSPALITFQNTVNGHAFGFNSTGTQRFTFINGSLTEIASISLTGAATFNSSVTASYYDGGVFRVYTSSTFRGGIGTGTWAFGDGSNDMALYSESGLKFGAGTSQKMCILSGGNVGIGTTLPVSKLHVVGDGDTVTLQKSNNVPALAFLGTSTNKSVIEGGDTFNFYTGGSSRVYIKNDGTFGINTTNPGAKLEVRAGSTYTGHTQPAIKLTNAGYRDGYVDSYTEGAYFTHYFENYTGGNGRFYDRVLEIVCKGSPDGTYGEGVISFKANPITNGAGANEIMRITGSGRVGIGTASPSVKLEVVESATSSGGVAVFQRNIDALNEYAHIKVGNTSYPAYFGSMLGTYDIAYMSMSPDPTDGKAIVIRTVDGNVGIGTTTPANRLSVEGGNIKLNNDNAAANYYLWLNKQNSQDGGILLSRDNVFDWQIVNATTSGDLWAYAYGAGTVAMAIKRSNAYVGIGTTLPAEKLDVAGVIRSRGTNNHESIITKEGSTGSFTFSASELNGGSMDNVNYFIFVSVYNPTTDILLDTASLVIHGVMPRGSGSTFSTISTLKAGGISTLTATNNSNDLVITTDSGTNFRCSVKVIAIGGTS